MALASRSDPMTDACTVRETHLDAAASYGVSGFADVHMYRDARGHPE